MIGWKEALLRRVAAGLHARAAPGDRRSLEAFSERCASWLGDYALFRALKARWGGRAWTEWPEALARRDPAALRAAGEELAEEVRSQLFCQWAFFRQWGRLRERCRSMGIRLMGDLPIYVAHDSAEVWARPELFQLDARGRPAAVAGVPPDYFSATGQLWGNPLYRWDALARTGYAWWIERFRAVLSEEVVGALVLALILLLMMIFRPQGIFPARRRARGRPPWRAASAPARAATRGPRLPRAAASSAARATG